MPPRAQATTFLVNFGHLLSACAMMNDNRSAKIDSKVVEEISGM